MRIRSQGESPTMIRGPRGAQEIAAAILLTSLGVIGCANALAKDEAKAQARSRGKYRVTLTTERERVVGTCKFVRTILADADSHRPSNAELPDYFRVEAVYIGADTVLVDGRTGEAYICGPGPLNPDGSPQVPPQAPPAATPSPR
jgi:hypothetical protein